MASSAHKRIVFAGMGCAAAIVGLVVLGVIVVLRERPSFFSDIATIVEVVTPAASKAAVDSLDGMSWAALESPRSDQLSLPVSGRLNGALLARKVWINPRFLAPVVPFGDTAADSSRRREIWRTYAAYTGIDSLLRAAAAPWDLAAATDSADGLLTATTNPYVPMNSTRAMLARAADSSVSADSGLRLARAVITIGRKLQQDLSLVHVVTGLRVERDGLAFLARRGSAEARAALPEVENALAVGLRGLHLIRIAGALAGNAAVLAEGANDATLPVAVRREMLLAIGYGWGLNAQETGAFVRERERSAALDAIKPEALPAALRPGLVLARQGAGLSVATRLVVGPQYQTLTAALRMTW